MIVSRAAGTTVPLGIDDVRSAKKAETMSVQFFNGFSPSQLQSLGLGIDFTSTEEDIAQHLRQKTVSEWSNFPDRYQSFLTDTTVAEESLHFLESGYFNHELENTMPLATANAMGILIVIISSLENQPVFRIDPEDPLTSEPIILAYNQYGLGHYDAVSD